jgi:hypothetical protein
MSGKEEQMLGGEGEGKMKLRKWGLREKGEAMETR